MTPENYVLRRLILPGLKLVHVVKISDRTFHYICEKKTEWEVCRKYFYQEAKKEKNIS